MDTAINVTSSNFLDIDLVGIVPKPKEVTNTVLYYNNSTQFTVSCDSTNTFVCFNGSESNTTGTLDELKSVFSELLSDNTRALDTSGFPIKLVFAEKYETEEYVIKAHVDKIEIIASTYNGFLYGLVTLIPFIEVDKSPVPVLIKDKPLKGSRRSVNLDVVRSMVSVAEIKKIIKSFTLCKLNCLHLHLTDNEGWRFDLPSWPLLATSAVTKTYFNVNTFVSSGINTSLIPNLPIDTSYNPVCYSNTDLLEIVDYARKHGVEIIPEADLPGHSAALLAVYPQLGTQAYPVAYGVKDTSGSDGAGNYPYLGASWGGFNFPEGVYKQVMLDANSNVVPEGTTGAVGSGVFMHPGYIPWFGQSAGTIVSSNAACLLPTPVDTSGFFRDLYSYFASVFPSKYIHIGGDQVSTRAYATKYAYDKMASIGLSVSDAEDYTLKTIRYHVKAVNRIPISWGSNPCLNSLRKYGLSDNSLIYSGASLMKGTLALNTDGQNAGVYEPWLSESYIPLLKNTYDVNFDYFTAVEQFNMKIMYSKASSCYFDNFQSNDEFDAWVSRGRVSRIVDTSFCGPYQSYAPVYGGYNQGNSITEDFVYNTDIVEEVKINKGTWTYPYIKNAILGGEVSLWGEYMFNNIKVYEHKLYPRGFAHAERCWYMENPKDKDYSSYVRRRQILRSKLISFGYNCYNLFNS